jgi:CheY-like chemotaxis protein
MNPKGILIFIDDDHDEFVLFKRVFATFSDNEIKYAANGEAGLKLVHEHKDNIFMIISDINMPVLNGLELKRMIEGTPALKIKSIPFVYRTTHNNVVVIKEAYGLGIQGLFIKSAELKDLQTEIDLLLRYWMVAVHPNILD